jgi:hypothetical protein
VRLLNRRACIGRDKPQQNVRYLTFQNVGCCGEWIPLRAAESQAMPRFFFHFSDGKRRFSDAAGYELSGMAAAREQAVKQVRDLKAAMCDPGIQDLSGWTMIVFDQQQKVVFEIGFDLRVRP